LALFSFACESPVEHAYVGECADYPDSSFDYGQIGIGNCLAGPTALAWVPQIDDPSASVLVVANANPFQDFTGGSVLSIDAAGLPQGGETVRMHELAAQGFAGALDLPSFAGGMAVVEELGVAAISVRYSEGADDLDQDDNLWLVDLRDPTRPALAELAEAGAAQVLVEADPLAVSYDPLSGMAFVANISSGSVSVVDMLADPVAVIDAVAKARFENRSFVDQDASGSQVSIADLDVGEVSLLSHDEWTLHFVEGQFRLWTADEEGISHRISAGQDQWKDSALGVELTHLDTDGAWGPVVDPQLWSGLGGVRMAMADSVSGDLVAATAGASLGVWSYEAAPLLRGRSGEWDAQLGGPMPFFNNGVDFVFYDGHSESGESGIGFAVSEDGLNYIRANNGDPVLDAGAGAHDSDSIADPTVLFDAQADTWRMFYSAWNGSDWSIGHATSPDLLNWTADLSPVFEQAAAPVVVYSNGQFRMWASRWTGTEWALVSAISTDGYDWDDLGIVAELSAQTDLTQAPGPGLQVALDAAWSIEGEVRGMAGVSFQSGETHNEFTVGWSLFLSAGAVVDTDDLDRGVNGVMANSWIVQEDWVFGTWTDINGVNRIGQISDPLNGGSSAAVVLEGESGAFDADGVSHPVVYAVDSGWAMLYAGQSDGLTAIGLATSTDGIIWSTDHQPALVSDQEWSALRVQPGSVVANTDGSYTLWFTGSDGGTERIGRAVSSNGLTWAFVEGPKDPWIFEEGAPGAFDDTAVADPFVLKIDDTTHLWYSAFDGNQWQIGYAYSKNSGTTWVRPVGSASAETRAVVSGVSGQFDQLSARNPVVVQGENGFQMLYTGLDAAVNRVGLAQAQDPAIWYRDPAVPTSGDTVHFDSLPGDEGDRDSISLSQTIAGFTTSGLGITASHVDTERGFLYLSSAASAYIYVVDIRDDSTSEWSDNLYEIEAILVASIVPGAIGFRAMVAPAGSPYLYAVNDDPESVMLFNLDQVLDDNLGQVHLEAVVGGLPMPRGGEKDVGADTLASVGPSNLLVQGDRLFVANFNANSISVVDLSLGVHGTLVHEVLNIGENPHAMVLSPDGSLLAVASLVGAVDEKRSQSRIALLNTDTLEIVGWIANE
jgi:predicted GH43/DUF377 family glycosyl hydrolase/DNA-binding beta-propeller fold protein YncE